jgi:hypothetical protein
MVPSMKKAQGTLPLDDGEFTKAFDTWLAERPKAATTLKAFITRMRPKLKDARANGVTYEQLATFLREQGIECSVSTLKAYLAAKRRPKPGGTAAKTPVKSDPRSPIPPTSAPRPGLKGGINERDL